MSESYEYILSMGCCLCHQVLSVPPLISISENREEVKCGRCKNVRTPFEARNLEIEEIARRRSFPCINDGCDEIIPWGQVERHEELCRKRTIRCPISSPTLCMEIIRREDFKRHVMECHRNNIGTGCIQSIVDKNSYKIDLITFLDQEFLVMTSNVHELSWLTIHVFSLEHMHSPFVFDAILSRPAAEGGSLLVKNQPIEYYDETHHCLGCIIGECDLIHHPMSTVNNDVPFAVDCMKIGREKIAFFGDYSEIDFRIMIHQSVDEGKKEKPPANHKYPTGRIQESIREKLECPVCIEYMTEEIHNCDKGHSLCGNCAKKMIACPVCRSGFSYQRNSVLEDIAREALFSCAFAGEKCDFIGTLKVVSEHEITCSKIH